MSIRTFALLAVLFLLPGCLGVGYIPNFESLSSEQVFARVGPHTKYDKIYIASSAKENYQAVVRQMFPPDELKSKHTLIREIIWERGGYKFAVFFRRQQGYWIAIGQSRYQDADDVIVTEVSYTYDLFMNIHIQRPPVVELDTQAQAAYVQFSDHTIAKTVPLKVEEHIVTVDLDSDEKLIGVELIGVEEFGVESLLEEAGFPQLSKETLAGTRYVSAAWVRTVGMKVHDR